MKRKLLLNTWPHEALILWNNLPEDLKTIKNVHKVRLRVNKELYYKGSLTSQSEEIVYQYTRTDNAPEKPRHLNDF